MKRIASTSPTTKKSAVKKKAVAKKTVTKKKPAATSTKVELRYQKRSAAVAAVRRGEPASLVARVHHVPLRTLFLWLAVYRQGGESALRDRPKSGRPRKVTDQVMRWLYEAITLGDPTQYQFPFCLWTLSIIRTMLKREHGINLSKSGVSRLLAHLGLSAQRPIYRAYQQDPAKLEQYLKRTFPQLRALAKQMGALIYFLDEAAIRVDAHRGTTWGRIGETPVVRDSGGRFGLNLISAVSPRGDMKFKMFEGRMNGERFVEFLKALLADAGQPIIVIMDNARYHKGPPVREFIRANKAQVAVEYLPPYAPELNPDEQVWNHAKGRLAKLFVATKEELVTAARNTMRSLQRSRDLIRSFFELDDTRYAANAC